MWSKVRFDKNVQFLVKCMSFVMPRRDLAKETVNVYINITVSIEKLLFTWLLNKGPADD